MFDAGAQLMPTAWTLESYKLGDTANVKRHDITFAMILVFVVVYLVGFLLILPVIYEWGALNLREIQTTTNAYGAFQFPYAARIFDGLETIYMTVSLAFGGVITLFINIMELRYVWWPFNALGFALGNCPFWLEGNWFNAFLAFVIKSLTTRWGGRGALLKLNSFS